MARRRPMRLHFDDDATTLRKARGVVPVAQVHEECVVLQTGSAAADTLVIIPRDTYDAMGAPPCITVTIRPGDRLN